MGRRRALALPLLLLLGACTHRGRAHDASSSAAASVGPEGGVRLLGDVAAPAFSPQLLDAARELAERRQAELAVRREQALELFNRAEAQRACRADAFPHRRGSPKRRAAADAGGGAAVDPREIVALYRQAAALRAGPGSAAAAGTLARMCEWGWDGVGDLSRYEPAGLRRAAAGGGGGGGTAGAALEGWHEALLATSAGAWASEHVPGLRTLVTWLGGVDVRAALQSLWAPLGGGAGHHHDAHSAGAAAPLGDPAAAATAGAPMVVPHNMSCAVEWYATAAGLGNASAQFVMGVLHMHGLFGVRPSAPAALAQWVFAALGGSLDAATALGLRHATGDGVPKSCASAVSYLEAPARARADAVAASAGLLQAAPSPTHTRLTDTAYESLHSESLRGEGQVVTYYHTAAERGDTNAHVALAHLYLLGVRGVVQDLPAAAEHFHAAAEAAEPLSLANLGYMYLHGLGACIGRVTGVRGGRGLDARATCTRHSRRVPAPRLHDPLARAGVERNPTLAREFLKVPVEAGLPAAVTTLAFMYVTGQGAERDAATAAALLKRAADAGHADAHYNLGMLHLEVRACACVTRGRAGRGVCMRDVCSGRGSRVAVAPRSLTPLTTLAPPPRFA
jgi:TPR repeat protein